MKADQIFGVLVVLLAIYLAVTAVQGGVGTTASGLFSGGNAPFALDGTGDPPFARDSSGDGGGSLFGSTSDAGGDGGGPDSSGNGDDDDDEDEDGGSRSSDSGGGGKARSTQSARSTTVVMIEESDFCASALATTPAFSDVDRAQRAAVQCMAAAGIVRGVSEERFVPRDAVTRGQAAIAIAAMIDLANELEAKGIDLRELPPADAARFEEFKDASVDCPGERAIARLDETPVLRGYVDARFEPCGKITRAQMASLLDRAYQFMNGSALPIGDKRFTDTGSSVHEESIDAVTSADIMQGTGNRRFRPGRSVERAEMASSITLVMIRMEDKGRIVPLG